MRRVTFLLILSLSLLLAACSDDAPNDVSGCLPGEIEPELGHVESEAEARELLAMNADEVEAGEYSDGCEYGKNLYRIEHHGEEHSEDADHSEDTDHAEEEEHTDEESAEEHSDEEGSEEDH
jgi:hypothetical protein